MKNCDCNFMTIRQAARTGVLPENAIRGLVKLNLCPGFYVGNRFYVDMSEFHKALKQLKAVDSYRH